MNEPNLMKNISGLKYCYGCGVCVNACPVSIISFSENSDGFYRPLIKEQDQCIDCGLCLRTCSFHNSPHPESDRLSAFAGWSKDPALREISSSGGISPEIARVAFSLGYKAIGAKYNPDEKRVEHFVASSQEEYSQSIGSKYLQSFTPTALSHIDFKDKNGKWMIVGTPCQIDSLRRLAQIKKAEDRFILVDFFCHGVPSRLLWLRYLAEIAKKGVDPSQTFRWRDKKYGWHDSWAITDETYFSKWTAGDMFYTLFLGNYCLNRSCYDDCKFKKTFSSADIRIGDFWGKKFVHDEKGVSGILALTPTGDKTIDELRKSCKIESIEVKELLHSQMNRLPYRWLPRFLTLQVFKFGLPLKTADIIRRIFNHI